MRGIRELKTKLCDLKQSLEKVNDLKSENMSIRETQSLSKINSTSYSCMHIHRVKT